MTNATHWALLSWKSTILRRPLNMALIKFLNWYTLKKAFQQYTKAIWRMRRSYWNGLRNRLAPIRSKILPMKCWIWSLRKCHMLLCSSVSDFRSKIDQETLGHASDHVDNVYIVYISHVHRYTYLHTKYMCCKTGVCLSVCHNNLVLDVLVNLLILKALQLISKKKKKTKPVTFQFS